MVKQLHPPQLFAWIMFLKILFPLKDVAVPRNIFKPSFEIDQCPGDFFAYPVCKGVVRVSKTCFIPLRSYWAYPQVIIQDREVKFWE